MTEKISIDESKDKQVLAAWRLLAKEMTLENLPGFLKGLTENYEHDYGTIVHAIANAGMTVDPTMLTNKVGTVRVLDSASLMQTVRLLKRKLELVQELNCIENDLVTIGRNGGIEI